MAANDVLVDAYGRITQVVERAIDGIDPAGLTWQPEPGSNPIAWLVWHLTRIQDDHLAKLAGEPQVWETDGWPERFGLESGSLETGHGHTMEQVLTVRPDSVTTLREYHDWVSERSQAYLADLDDAELQRVVDDSYEPPVTLGVRLVSVISDNLQHAGQARYLRGMYDRLQG